MRLALELGWFNVDAMLETAPPAQLIEWAAYWECEPFGNSWERMSLGATVIANEIRGGVACFGSGKKDVEFIEHDALVPGRLEKRQQELDAATHEAIDQLEVL